jgi:hypothetical protein
LLCVGDPRLKLVGANRFHAIAEGLQGIERGRQ